MSGRTHSSAGRARPPPSAAAREAAAPAPARGPRPPGARGRPRRGAVPARLRRGRTQMGTSSGWRSGGSVAGCQWAGPRCRPRALRPAPARPCRGPAAAAGRPAGPARAAAAGPGRGRSRRLPSLLRKWPWPSSQCHRHGHQMLPRGPADPAAPASRRPWQERGCQRAKGAAPWRSWARAPAPPRRRHGAPARPAWSPAPLPLVTSARLESRRRPPPDSGAALRWAACEKRAAGRGDFLSTRHLLEMLRVVRGPRAAG